MAPSLETLSIHDDLPEVTTSKSPLKGDLRKLMSENPLPLIAPGTVDPVSVEGDKSTKLALATIARLNHALASENAEMLASCFFPEQSYWKDQLALTYHLRTFAKADVIAASLLETKALRGLGAIYELTGDASFVPATPVLQFIIFGFKFTTATPAATCTGRTLLLPTKPTESEELAWKIWILSTKLENLDLHPEREALLQSASKHTNSLGTFDTDVFIVGGGNAAVALAARLKALGVESVMAERNPHAGDNWARRYDCLKFHVPTAMCELPYMNYDKEMQSPHLLTKDELAQQVSRYVSAFKLNIINSAEILETTQLSDRRWEVKFQTPAGTRTVVTKHLVQATGFGSQKPYIPSVADQQLYKGISIHSQQFKNAEELKKQGANSVLIIGSANTAFDVLEDCCAAGLQTTMNVRSPTYLVPIEYVSNPMSLGIYDIIGAEAADQLMCTIPSIVDSQFAKGLFAHLASQDSDRYAALKANTNFPVIDSTNPDMALMHNLLERGGGHYVDIGGVALLTEGKAAVKANVEPVAYTSTGVRFSDGTTMDVDAIIWCTGYSDKDATTTATDIMKTKSKLEVDATWGIDQEGEIRGMWKRHSKLDNYWMMGGFAQQHRYYSRVLALQIKAALEGVLPEAYLDTPQPTVAINGK